MPFSQYAIVDTSNLLEVSPLDSIHHFSAENIFDQSLEAHYEIHRFINKNDFPQVHDFYEFSLVLSGELTISINGKDELLGKNQVLFIQPSVVHDKEQITETVHMNFAFSKHLMDELFRYLNITHYKKVIMEDLFITPQTLSNSMMKNIKQLIQELSVIPIQNTSQKKALVRLILIDILVRLYLPLAQEKQNQMAKGEDLTWFNELLGSLNQQENFIQGVPVLSKLSDKNQSYICRVFQKQLGLSPSKYINQLKLNYAANLILHSDYEILDIVYESGFQSVSYFYQIFKDEFQLTPQQFRKQMAHYQI